MNNLDKYVEQAAKFEMAAFQLQKDSKDPRNSQFEQRMSASVAESWELAAKNIRELIAIIRQSEIPYINHKYPIGGKE